MVALLSPPGAMQNEWFHAATIWCGQGERTPFCNEVALDPDTGFSATVSFDATMCEAHPRVSLLCPTDRDGETRWSINDGEFPGIFHFFLSWFVTPSLDLSIVVMRLANAFLLSALLFVTMFLLPTRHRITLVLMLLTSLVPSAYLLLASIGPNSWTLLGVATSWIPLHAAFDENVRTRQRRIALVGVSATLAFLAVGSRWEASAFLVFSTTLTLCLVASKRLPGRQVRAICLISMVSTASWFFFTRVLPSLSLFEIWKGSPDTRGIFSRWLFSYVPGRPDEVSILNEGLIQGLPKAFRALWAVPASSIVRLPELIYVVGVVLLGHLIIETRNRSSRGQIVGPIVILCFISLAVLVQVPILNTDEFRTAETVFVQPLFMFAAGWWYLSGPDDLHGTVVKFLRPVAAISVGSFALAIFTIAERFVDRQTDGIRYLPEGPDQWWWPSLPFGPNVPVVLAPIFLWLCYQNLVKSLSARPVQFRR